MSGTTFSLTCCDFMDNEKKEKELREGDMYKVFCLDPHDLYIEYEKDENINDQENIRRLCLNNCIRKSG